MNLRSYRKDGSAADTPVWVASLDDKLVVFTLRHTYKVKRIRSNPKVQLAKCDKRGKLLGEWVDGTCRAVDDDPEYDRRAYAALTAKYGLMMRLGTLGSRLSGRIKKRLILEITL